ncbi:hypothetical protein ABIB90_000527 [Bradyrhizobium sp. JR4.1]|uniref:hypothetical protein n=1 Tax=Bradyrhizobium sp. JR4.1 TaxID=3156372 RepID=UPI00339B1BC5
MRTLDNPKLKARRLAPDIKIVVIEASTGETIAFEISDATAAEWAAAIAATEDAQAE